MSPDSTPIVSSVTVAVELEHPAAKVFAVANDHFRLSEWAHPIQDVRMKGGAQEVDYLLPDGVVTCPAHNESDAKKGTVDWRVDIPKGEPVQVYSRVLPLGEDRSVYVFTLLSPPMPRRRLKDAYTVVQKNLLNDLEKFKGLVAGGKKAAPAKKKAAKKKTSKRKK